MLKDTNSGYLKYVSLVTLILQNSAVALSMRYVRTRPGEMFVSSTGLPFLIFVIILIAVVAAEFIKLLSSFLLLYFESTTPKNCISTLNSQIWNQKMDTLKVALPSFVYLIQNNLLYISASNLDAATFQITYQMKILATALFAVALLNKKLRSWQWISLIFLTAGVALVQLSGNTGSSVSPGAPEQNRIIGCVAAILACGCSGFAGIYFEKILKGSDVSVWVRNIQLSMFSFPLGIITSLISDWKSITEAGFFYGYDAFVFFVVFLNAIGGLIVAVVVKYADNILKGFATSLAIILSTVCSMFLFDFLLSFQFVFGTAFVLVSVFLYSYEPPVSINAKLLQNV